MRDGNLFHDIPADLPEELVQTLLSFGTAKVARIVSRGHCSPPDFWYDQAQAEWVLLLQGAARLAFENHTVELRPGDHLDIPAHVKHRLDWTAPDTDTVWLAIFR